MDFVALDFETANSRADSACQLALVVVRGGEIVDEHCWLMRPPRLYFSPRNISIHGIRPDHVERAPTMQQLWTQLAPLLDGQVLVAHNAGFDIGVLVASLAAFDIACPTLEFSCTRAIARRAWPGRPRYGLKPLGNWLGIEFKHHDALEDARCCAQIAMAATGSTTYGSFTEFEQQLRLSRGRYCLGQIRNPRQIGGRSVVPKSRSLLDTGRLVTGQLDTGQPGPVPSQTDSQRRFDAPTGSPVRPPAIDVQFTRSRVPSRGGIDPVTIIEAAAGSQPLANKRIVCLGTLRGLSSDDTRTLIHALGGQCQTAIDSDTDYVIACGGMMLSDANQMVVREEEPTSTIRVLSERQFLSLLPGGKTAVRW